MASKPQIKHFGKVVKGRKVYYAPDLLRAELAAMEGQEFEEVTRKKTHSTTLNQSAYYRGVILNACYQSEMGSNYDKPDDIHDEYFAPRFLSYKKMIRNPDGTQREIEQVQSMSEMTTEETSAFIEKVLAVCAQEWGIHVAGPEDYYSKLYSKK